MQRRNDSQWRAHAESALLDQPTASAKPPRIWIRQASKLRHRAELSRRRLLDSRQQLARGYRVKREAEARLMDIRNFIG